MSGALKLSWPVRTRAELQPTARSVVVLRGALAEPPYEGRLLGRRESRMVASHAIESKERFGAPPVSPKAVNASEEFLG